MSTVPASHQQRKGPMLKKLEERLFWFLERRWREQATIDDIVRHRQWLVLDIHVKGGNVPKDFSTLVYEARDLLTKFQVRLEGPMASHTIDERIIALLKAISALNY